MSERFDRRAERVRRALATWDASRGDRELPDERVARMREAVLRSAASGRAPAQPVRGSSSSRHGSWPRLAFAAAAIALLAVAALLWARSRESAPEPSALARLAERPAEGVSPSSSEDLPSGAPAAGPRASRSPGSDEATARPTATERGSGGRGGSNERAPSAASVAAAAPDPASVQVATLEPASDVPNARPVASEAASKRRVRQLEFEAPSGRKIHWILDSEFRGVGGL